MRYSLPFLLALSMILFARVDTAAQTMFRLPIIVRNATPDGSGIKNRDTLLIGIDANATEGLDTALGERRLPPFPPDQIFESRLVDRSGRTAFGNGVKVDLRPVVNQTQRDTFIVRFQMGVGGTPVTLSWPSNIAEYAGKMTIKTLDGTFDMLTTTSLAIDNPDVSRVTIIREGDAIGSVDDASGAGFFELEPIRNPIRRGQDLAVGYVLSKSAEVRMELVDALGRPVAQHNAGNVGSGMNTATLKLDGFTTGSYMFMIIANDVVVTRKLLIVE